MKKTMLFLILMLSPLASSAESSTIRLAIANSIDSSGLLQHLLTKFKEIHPYKIQLNIVGSGKALRLGRTGLVDMVWVHSPEAEQKFVKDGYALAHKTIMRNDFVLAGPKSDPANIAAEKNVLEAMKRIASGEYYFMSRGDDSGTHKKEMALWNLVDIDPIATDWYMESGLGIVKTLKQAELDKSYLLIDRATFIARHTGASKILLKGDAHLANPYSLILVNQSKSGKQGLKGAQVLFDWLSSPSTQSAIASFRYAEHQLFFPTQNKP